MKIRALPAAALNGLFRCAACVGLLLGSAALAEPLLLTGDYREPLGRQGEFLVEEGGPLKLSEAYSAWRRGDFSPGDYAIASYGIDARPVWMQLELLNSDDRPLPRVLALGKTWMDHLHVYLVQDGRVRGAWRLGDVHPATEQLVPGVGYLLPLQIPPGGSQLFIRAQTQDPSVLSVRLRAAGGECGGCAQNPVRLQSVTRRVRTTHWTCGALRSANTRPIPLRDRKLRLDLAAIFNARCQTALGDKGLQ